MAPSLDLSRLWGKDTTRKGTPVVVTMENPNYSVLEINDPNSAFRPVEKDRGKNAKQFTWVLLLKAHQAVGCVAWLGNALLSLLGAIKRRLLCGQGVKIETDKSGKGRLLFRTILAFLLMSMAFLAFEVVAYLKGWHYFQNNNLHIPQTSEIRGWLQICYLAWLAFRADYIAPMIQALSTFCVALFMIQSTDRMLLCLGCFWIKYKKIKPRVEGDPFKSEDLEGSSNYPMVLVQIPMCNEREVYEQSVSAVCQLDWPKDHLLIQVLDDSDDESIQWLIKGEVLKWNQRGVNIIYRHRLVRTGYKAGNLKSAMNCDYVKGYEYVAIFDADFQPNPDFLKQTVPHFKDNPELGLVQARWSFVNKDENLLTRLQNINLCFHFEVEQQVNGIFLNFFGFNGTAGVWRIKALEESGGWLERTTVEDMDIAVRAHLNGWKFIFLNDVKVLCEVPESYEAYKKQQHRWHSGPMHLFRICLPAIITSKIPCWKKANLILLFFLLRKLILPFYSFTLFCIILPLTMFVPEAELPIWVICYVPVFMSFLNEGLVDMECHMIDTSRRCLDKQASWFSWNVRNLDWNIPRLKCNVALRMGSQRLAYSHRAYIRKHPKHHTVLRTFSVPVSLEEESSSLHSEGYSSNDVYGHEDSPEGLLTQPLSTNELKSLLADSERGKLTKKLSEANQHNRFLKRQLHIKEDALVNFKSELAVAKLELQALVSLAEEIAKSGIPAGTRKINGKYVQSHLLLRLEALHEKLKEQIDDVDAVQLKEVPLFWCGMAESVQVMGSFDGWSQGEHLSPEYTGSFMKFSSTLMLRPGRYEIKFLVDGEWNLSPEFPIVGEGLMKNNLLIVG